MSQESLQRLQFKELVTTVYLSSFLVYLYSTHQLLLIGKMTNLMWMLGLPVLEILKQFISKKQSKTSDKNVNILKTCGTTVVLFLFVYISAVLLGAPFLSKWEETFTLTLWISLLTILPVCINFGGETAFSMFTSITSYSGCAPENVLLFKVRTSLFGAWLGAVLIPLDWNRPWQNWPIPCCFGLFLGNIIGSLYCCVLYQIKYSSSEKSGKYRL